MLINKPDGFGGYPEGVRGKIQGWEDRLQGRDGMELHVYPTELHCRWDFKRVFSSSPEALSLASGWASQESCPDCEVFGRIVVHVLYTDEFEAALVHPKDVIAF